MADSRFVLLARVERQGMITACKQGVAHLGWENVIVRLPFDAFRRLVHLLELGATEASAVPMCDGDLCVVIEDGDYRVTMGRVELVLSQEQYFSLAEMASGALRRLDEVLASGDWPEPRAEPPPLTSPDELYTPRFSLS